jgi:N12 class adenine-specific DNA methylase
MGAMELRRLKLVSKPAIVVPNHMLEQFGREFLQLYPRRKS